MSDTTYQRPRFVPAPEQAKMLRGALKAEFPGVKFSVRCSRGSAIDVSWVDGPRSSHVQAICDLYRGGGFDGMQDLRYNIDTVLTTDEGAEVVQFSADFVFAHREISDAWRREVFAMFSNMVGRTLDPDVWGVWKEQVPLHVTRDGDLLRMADQYTSDVRDVFHQYTATRDR